MDFFENKINNDYSIQKYQNLVYIYKIKNSRLRNISIKLPGMYLLMDKTLHVHLRKCIWVLTGNQFP